MGVIRTARGSAGAPVLRTAYWLRLRGFTEWQRRPAASAPGLGVPRVMEVVRTATARQEPRPTNVFNIQQVVSVVSTAMANLPVSRGGSDHIPSHQEAPSLSADNLSFG